MLLYAVALTQTIEYKMHKNFLFLIRLSVGKQI